MNCTAIYFCGEDPEDPKVIASFTNVADDLNVKEAMFDICNQWEDSQYWNQQPYIVIQPRFSGVRSMSVGDFVAIYSADTEPELWQVKGVGWHKVGEPDDDPIPDILNLGKMIRLMRDNGIQSGQSVDLTELLGHD